MKLRRIRIENFQSIVHLELDIEGVTVLVGPSDQGKSAIIRAITAVFTNPPGKSFIRSGARSTEVQLDFDDDTSVLYRKGASASYEVVDKSGVVTTYDKMGRDVPPEVKRILKWWEVEGTPRSCIQIQGQRDADFVLGMTRAGMARALDSLDARVYREGLTSCESTVRGLKREDKELIARREQWTAKAEKAREADALIERWNQANELGSSSAELMRCLLKERIPELETPTGIIQATALASLPAELSVSNLETAIDAVKAGFIDSLLPDEMDVGRLDDTVAGLKAAFIEVHLPSIPVVETASLLVDLYSACMMLSGSEPVAVELSKELETVEAALFEGGVCPLCGSVVNGRTN